MPTFIKKIHSKKERIETLEKSLSELDALCAPLGFQSI